MALLNLCRLEHRNSWTVESATRQFQSYPPTLHFIQFFLSSFLFAWWGWQSQKSSTWEEEGKEEEREEEEGAKGERGQPNIV